MFSPCECASVSNAVCLCASSEMLMFLLCSSPERPIKFIQELKNVQVQEGNGVTLVCELSKPGVPVQWMKADKVLTNGEKFQMRQSGATLELLIRKSQPEDSGIYSCVCDDIKTTATIIITGEGHETENTPTLQSVF